MRTFNKVIYEKIALALMVLVIVAGFVIGVADRIVTDSAAGRLYSTVTADMPHHRVGLLLGTSKRLRTGALNQYYKNRIDAAVELFNSGKVDYILVSGDKHGESYDEPTAMQDDLEQAGIPADRILVDYEGFRTIDSIVRCKQVFGEAAVTVISQKFHNERAIYLAAHKGIDAIGYNAKDVTAYYGMKTQLREKLARVKMFADII